MPKKKKKSKTQARYWNALVSAFRTSFARYHPTYEEVANKARVELPKYNKNGELSKVPDVYYKCNECGDLVKEYNIDHKDTVVPLFSESKYMSLDEIDERIRCEKNPDNLQVICKPCHDKKTKKEKEKRKELKGKEHYVIVAFEVGGEYKIDKITIDELMKDRSRYKIIKTLEK